MRELKLKYLIDLVSNIGARSAADAKAMQQAQALIARSIAGTNDRFVDYSKLSLLAGKNTAQLQELLTGATNKFAALERAMDRAGRNTSIERQVNYMRQLAAGIDAAHARMSRLGSAAARGVGAAGDVATGALASGVAGYMGGRAVVAPPLKAYANLEAATMDLRIAMTDAAGKVAPAFDKISAEAVKLGNELPGTTKDFMLAARALMTQGVPANVAANGGLRASAYVGALLGVDQSQAAEVIAKLREAHGLKDSELVPMADLVQRAFFGFGIKPQEYLETAKYAASTYNTMGITGLAQTRETLAIQGMAANVGLEASSFGTNYSMMLRRLAQVEPRLAKKSAEAKEAKKLLDEHGIQMSFYDDAGVFKGNLNMLQQLAKLRGLNPLQQTHVIERLFGTEAGRPAQIMVQKGLEGYQQALDTLGNQGDLNTRLAMSTSTLRSKFEQLTGSVENLQAQIGTQLGNTLKRPIDRANDAVGGPLMDLAKEHPTATTGGLVGLGALSAWLSARMAGGLWSRLTGGAAAEAAAGAAARGPGLSLAASTSVLGRMARSVPVVSLLAETMGTSDAELDVLRTADRMRLGYRGKGYADPRLLDGAPNRARGYASNPAMDILRLTAPGMDALQVPLSGAGPAQVNLGEGRLALDVHVTDDRVSVTSRVARPMSLIRIDAGNTNPGGF